MTGVERSEVLSLQASNRGRRTQKEAALWTLRDAPVALSGCGSTIWERKCPKLGEESLEKEQTEQFPRFTQNWNVRSHQPVDRPSNELRRGLP